MQGDLDGGRARRDGVIHLLPTEGEDDLLLGHDLDVLPGRLGLTPDQHAVEASGPWVDIGSRAVPSHDLVGVDEERPDGFRRRLDHDLANELGHHFLPFVCRLRASAASATSRRRSRPDVQ